MHLLYAYIGEFAAASQMVWRWAPRLGPLRLSSPATVASVVLSPLARPLHHTPPALRLRLMELDLQSDCFTVANTGPNPALTQGWSVASPTVHPSAAAQRYQLPSNFELDPDAKIVVWSGRQNDERKPALGERWRRDADGTYHMYWTGRNMWNNGGDVAVLLNAEGQEVSRLARRGGQQSGTQSRHITLVDLDLVADKFTVANRGASLASTDGWSVASPTVNGGAAVQRFEFPKNLELGPNGKIVVWSGRKNEAWKPEQQTFPHLNEQWVKDAEGTFHVYWTGRNMWNNGGDVAVLLNPEGKEVARLAGEVPAAAVASDAGDEDGVDEYDAANSSATVAGSRRASSGSGSGSSSEEQALHRAVVAAGVDIETKLRSSAVSASSEATATATVSGGTGGTGGTGGDGARGDSSLAMHVPSATTRGSREPLMRARTDAAAWAGSKVDWHLIDALAAEEEAATAAAADSRGGKLDDGRSLTTATGVLDIDDDDAVARHIYAALRQAEETEEAAAAAATTTTTTADQQAVDWQLVDDLAAQDEAQAAAAAAVAASAAIVSGADGAALPPSSPLSTGATIASARGQTERTREHTEALVAALVAALEQRDGTSTLRKVMVEVVSEALEKAAGRVRGVAAAGGAEGQQVGWRAEAAAAAEEADESASVPILEAVVREQAATSSSAVPPLSDVGSSRNSAAAAVDGDDDSQEDRRKVPRERVKAMLRLHGFDEGAYAPGYLDSVLAQLDVDQDGFVNLAEFKLIYATLLQAESAAASSNSSSSSTATAAPYGNEVAASSGMCYKAVSSGGSSAENGGSSELVDPELLASKYAPIQSKMLSSRLAAALIEQQQAAKLLEQQLDGGDDDGDNGAGSSGAGSDVSDVSVAKRIGFAGTPGWAAVEDIAGAARRRQIAQERQRLAQELNAELASKVAAADQKAAEESVAAREVIALAESLELELELAVAKKADEDAMATTVETDLEIQPEAYLGGTVPIVDPAELKPSAAARLKLVPRMIRLQKALDARRARWAVRFAKRARGARGQPPATSLHS